MIGYLIVFIGAGVGGSIRHGFNIWVARLMGTHFPYHTLVINVLGSLVMGLVAGWFATSHRHSGRLHDLLRLLARRAPAVGAS